MTSFAILGAGGHARVVAEAAIASGMWSDIEWYDDTVQRMPDGTVVVGTLTDFLESLKCKRSSSAIVAIGACNQRLAWLNRLVGAEVQLAQVVHPFAWISPSAQVGGGSVVLASAVINAGAVLGSGAIINTGASVDHDCSLGRCVHVAPGARLAGNVKVGDGSWIGIGASVMEGVVIGAGVTVGAGAVVITDVIDGCTVIGVPARLIRSRNHQFD